MNKFFDSVIGRFRLISFIEGLSLVLLVFVAMPMKYVFGQEALVKSIGPIHGALFLIFVVAAIHISITQKWSFKNVTWKVLLACMIPFATFYVDYAILSKMHEEQRELGQ